MNKKPDFITEVTIKDIKFSVWERVKVLFMGRFTLICKNARIFLVK